MSKLYADIIDRIEYVRKIRGLNKSKFSSAIGMKPQTYNNFIGAQRSKPNIELIYGIVDKYDVNPYWLLRGVGPIYATDAANLAASKSGRGSAGAISVHDRTTRAELTPETYQELREQLDEVDPLLDEMKDKLRQLEISQYPLLESVMSLLKRYMELDPAGATEEVNALLARLRQKFAAT